MGSYKSTLWFTNLNDTTAQSFKFTLTVTKATPILTWTNPVAIIYGTALFSNQLNATANAAGSFVYSSTNGTVLNKVASIRFQSCSHRAMLPITPVLVVV